MRKLKVTELNRLGIAEYKAQSKLPLTIILDNVRSLHNVGSIFRTSDAFRIEEIYLCGITACPPNAEIHKTALGAESAVGWQYFNSAAKAASQLKLRGYTICAVEQAEGSLALSEWRAEPGRKYAVIFGHEVKGVANEVMDMCDICIEIPQFGTKHSLNVAVAAGIVLWQMRIELKAAK
ncbi:MAG: RNA methyltransferase [Tannerellaceae bacterium]|jgi:tRNA G18 (ribose-2'-O)-methylase SpoU|nr:RNA methyltransferase [Tannerellaceae bacterium]